jgi:hypothetical protein
MRLRDSHLVVNQTVCSITAKVAGVLAPAVWAPPMKIVCRHTRFNVGVWIGDKIQQRVEATASAWKEFLKLLLGEQRLCFRYRAIRRLTFAALNSLFPLFGFFF